MTLWQKPILLKMISMVDITMPTIAFHRCIQNNPHCQVHCWCLLQRPRFCFIYYSLYIRLYSIEVSCLNWTLYPTQLTKKCQAALLSAMGQYLTLVYLLSLDNTCQRKHNRAKYKKRWQNNSVMSENFSIASDCTMCNAHVLFRTGPGDQGNFFRVKVVFGQNWRCRPAQLCSGTYATF